MSSARAALVMSAWILLTIGWALALTGNPEIAVLVFVLSSALFLVDIWRY